MRPAVDVAHPLSLNAHNQSTMKIFAVIICMLSLAFGAAAQTEVRFYNEANDTIVITELLNKAAAMDFRNPEERVAFFGRSFIGTPYGAHTLEGDPEMLTVNLDSLDCTTFVETSMALAFTIGENRTSWRDFVYNLRRLRYRGGVVDGYVSRLHYICDWAVDNKHRGNFTDVTRDFPRYTEIRRTINFMSRHRDSYVALADSANFEKIRDVENGYRQHLFPYIKTMDLGKKEVKAYFNNGDVVALVSNLKDLDVTHVGMVVKESATAEPYLLHASSKNGKVEITSRPLAEFMSKNRQWLGLRVFRLNE